MPDRNMSNCRIYVDFLKTDGPGRVKLRTPAMRDLARYGITLSEGLALHLYTDDLGDDGERDDLIVEGVAHYDRDNKQWVAIIDWRTQRHVSEAGPQIPGYRTRVRGPSSELADYASSL